MKRVVHTALGIGFSVIGAALVIGFSMVLLRDHDFIAVLGITVGLVGIVLGWVVLTRFAYDVVADGHTLRLRFVFSDRQVPWTHLAWYRKIGVTWGFKVVGADLRAGVFIVLRYWRHAHGQRRAYRACLWTEGTGPGFSSSTEECATLFDRYAPERNWQKVRHPRAAI